MNQSRRFNMFQSLGQWLWMMAGRMDLDSITYYNPKAALFSTDGRTLGGAYGPRIFGQGPLNQLEPTADLIRARVDTRRAFVTIYVPEFDALGRDAAARRDEIPCTAALHYLPRKGSVQAVTMMRAQDALGLLPHDLFTLTLLQEYVACSAGADIGAYHHFASSLHYYLDRRSEIEPILLDSTSPGEPMPAMTREPQRPYLDAVLAVEEPLRRTCAQARVREKAWASVRADSLSASDTMPPFWRTVVLSLVAWGAFKIRDSRTLVECAQETHASVRPYLQRALAMLDHEGAESAAGESPARA